MANKKVIPKGQANERVFQNLTSLMELFGEKHSIRVGILAPEGSAKHEGSNLNNAELGAAHEFGATINHPGGQPYFINSATGMGVFVSKDSFYGKLLIARGQVTKPHTITLPAQSFLREPILGKEGRKEINNAIRQAWGPLAGRKDLKGTVTVENVKKTIKKTNSLVAEIAYYQVLTAFEGDKIRPKTKQSSKKKRRYNPNAPTLVDTGQLNDSISYEIDGIKWGKNDQKENS